MVAPNKDPIFKLTPFVAVGQVSAANPNLDGTGALATVKAAGAQGSLIEMIAVKATVTTTAGMIRLFLDDGVNVRLIKEIVVSVVVQSATVAAFYAEFVPTAPFQLPSGTTLKASTEKAEAMNVIAYGGDY